MVYPINPRILSDPGLTDTIARTVGVHRGEDGLEWVSLKRSSAGTSGSNRLVADESEPPYVTFV